MARFLSRQKLKNLSLLQNKFIIPEKYKGTFVEKWALYWKNLYADYRGMVQDLVTDIQEKPVKAFYITSGIVAVWQLAKNNPDETAFKVDLKHFSNELMLVGETCRNPKTVEHFKYIEKSYNEGVIRRLNLGIASLLWVDDYDDNCDLFKAKCDYTQPSYVSIIKRTVDIGCMGKWWNIYRKFQNFDVNM